MWILENERVHTENVIGWIITIGFYIKTGILTGTLHRTLVYFSMALTDLRSIAGGFEAPSNDIFIY